MNLYYSGHKAYESFLWILPVSWEIFFLSKIIYVTRLLIHRLQQNFTCLRFSLMILLYSTLYHELSNILSNIYFYLQILVYLWNIIMNFKISLISSRHYLNVMQNISKCLNISVLSFKLIPNSSYQILH